MKILIVEDEALVAMSLQFLLELEGHEVLGVADDFDTALAATEKERPELALVDIQLARGNSGFEVAAALQERGIACIFLTGNAPDRPRPDLALGCLPKPYSDAGLMSAIKVAEEYRGGRPPVPGSMGELQLY
jgi:CheY-like chemotaxis protein